MGVSKTSTSSSVLRFNSKAPERYEHNLTSVFFKLIWLIDILSTSSKISLGWMPQNPTDGKSTLVQVMAWCYQATGYGLSQCWPRSLSPNGITRPEWVNFGCTVRFGEILSVILNAVIRWMKIKIQHQRYSWMIYISKFVVSIMSADGLAPSDASCTSVASVMTEFGSTLFKIFNETSQNLSSLEGLLT